MANKIFPCKGCTNRAVGCHTYCEDYNKAKANYEKEKEEERVQKDIDNFLIESTLKRTDYYKSQKIYKKCYFNKDYID